MGPLNLMAICVCLCVSFETIIPNPANTAKAARSCVWLCVLISMTHDFSRQGDPDSIIPLKVLQISPESLVSMYMYTAKVSCLCESLLGKTRVL